VQKMGLLWMDNQYLCQISGASCQNAYISDIFMYLKRASIPARPLMVI
jgi:hypothetical protein